jgi:hypothetical protein
MIGKILVDQGAVSEAELQRMLALKAEESIFELFLWEDGQFRFLAGQLPAYELVPISLHVTSVTLEGIRRVDEWARIRRFIPSAQCVPVAVRDLLEGETEEARRAVLELVNDDRSVEEICLQTHSSEYFVSEILFQKASSGRLKVVRPRVVAAPVAAPGNAAAEMVAEARTRLAEQDFEQAAAAAGRSQPRACQSGAVARHQGGGADLGQAAGGWVDAAACRCSPVTAALGRPLTREGFILSRIGGAAIGSILRSRRCPSSGAGGVLEAGQGGLVEIRYPVEVLHHLPRYRPCPCP